MKAIIYARVSSIQEGRQNTDRQVSDLREWAKKNDIEVVRSFQEHISGAKKNTDRQILNDCFNFALSNGIDIVLFSELSRLGRSILEVQESIKYLVDNKINAYFQKEGLTLMDNGKFNPTTMVVISCLGMCAELERENISFRLNSGRKNAIAKGVKMGRKNGSIETIETKLEKYPEIVKKLRNGEKMTDICAWAKGKGISCSYATIKRLKAELGL